MADEFDWDSYPDAPEESNMPQQNAQFDWNQYPDYEKPGLNGVREDAKKIPGNLGSKMWNAITGIPDSMSALNKQLEGLDKQWKTYKGRARMGKVLTGAAAKGLNKLAHVPGNVADYFGNQGVWPEMDLHPDTLFPRDINHKKIYGVEDEQLGDKLLEGIGEFAPMMLPGAAITRGMGAAGLTTAAASPASALFMQSIGNNEEPFSSALMAPLLGKTVEMGARGVANVGRGAYNYGRSLSPEIVAPEVVGNYGQRMQGFRQEYGDILNAQGVRNPANAPHAFNPATQANQQHLQTVMQEAEAYTPRLREFLDNPTAENLHWARSDLDGLVRWVNNHERTALPGMKQARTAARNIVDQLNPVMDWTLEGAGPEAVAAYEAIGPRYRRDIIAPHPQELVNAIRAYERDEMSGHSLLNRARSTKNDTYGHRYAEQIPGVNRAMHENWWQNLPLTDPLVRLFKKKMMPEID